MDYLDISKYLEKTAKGGDEGDILKIREKKHIRVPAPGDVSSDDEDVEEFLNRFVDVNPSDSYATREDDSESEDEEKQDAPTSLSHSENQEQKKGDDEENVLSQ